MSVIKKLAGETALYGVSSILGRLLNYAMVPLHTAIFLPGELAITVKLFAYVAFLNIIYTYGMETAYFRFATKNTSNPLEVKNYYNSSLTSILLSSLLFSGIIILFAPEISTWLGYPGKELYVRWLAMTLAIDAIASIPFARLRLEKKAKQFAITRIINIGVNVAINLFFLFFCKSIYEGKYLPELRPLIDSIYVPTLGVGYIFLANLIANAAYILLLWNVLTDYRFKFDMQRLRPMWVYGYPILIMGLAGSVNLLVDRMLLEHLLPVGYYPGRTSNDALGIYGQCYKLSIFMSLVIQSFRYAAEPFFFSRAEDKDSPMVFANVMKWFIIACCLIWLGVSVNIDILKLLFLRNQVYWEGLNIVPWLLLGNLFLGIYYNLAVWFKLSDKTKYGTLITGIGAVVAVVFNILLIPVMGYMGCAITFALSCFVMAAICYVLGNKYYPIPYDLSAALGYIGAAGLLIYLASLLRFDNQWLTTGLHFLLCALYLSGIYLAERKVLASKKAPINPVN